MSMDEPGRRPARMWTVLPHWMRVAVAYGAALLVFSGVVYILAVVVGRLSSLVIAVSVALLLAALLMPLVDLLLRARLPRALAALVALLALLGVLTLVGLLFGVGFAREAGNLSTSIGDGVGRVRDWLVTGPLGLSQEQLDTLGRQAGERLRGAASGSLAGAATVLEVLGSVALALVLLFFLLKDGPAMARWVLGGVPEPRRERATRAAERGWNTLKAYVRGTAVIAAVDAAGIGIGLAVIGVPLVLPLALLTFVASFVPIIGATLAGAVAVLVALAAKGPVAALLVLGVVLLVQNTEGNLLEPLIMGRAVRLHPAVILVAVAAGTLLAGVAGALLATPIVAVTYRVVQAFREQPADEPEPA